MAASGIYTGFSQGLTLATASKSAGRRMDGWMAVDFALANRLEAAWILGSRKIILDFSGLPLPIMPSRAPYLPETRMDTWLPRHPSATRTTTGLAKAAWILGCAGLPRSNDSITRSFSNTLRKIRRAVNWNNTGVGFSPVQIFRKAVGT